MHPIDGKAPSGHSGGKMECRLPTDDIAAHKSTERELAKEDESERLLDEWLAKQSCAEDPAETVALENFRRRIFALIYESREKREEWERCFTYEAAALGGIADSLSGAKLGEYEDKALLDQFFEKLEHGETVDASNLPEHVLRVMDRMNKTKSNRPTSGTSAGIGGTVQ
jgi:hypothetical protein